MNKDLIDEKFVKLAKELNFGKSKEEYENLIRDIFADYFQDYNSADKHYRKELKGNSGQPLSKFREWLSEKIWSLGKVVWRLNGKKDPVYQIAKKLEIFDQLINTEVEITKNNSKKDDDGKVEEGEVVE